MTRPIWRAAGSGALDGWKGFAVAVLCGVVGVAALDFVTATGSAAPAQRAITSMQHGSALVAYALTFGACVWLCIRIFKGDAQAPEPKESVLWFASVALIVFAALRLF